MKTRNLFPQHYNNMENVKKAITQRKEKILEAFFNGDAKGVAMNYAENAKFFPLNRNVVQGLDRIEAFWRIIMKKGIIKAEFKTKNVGVSGATAIEIGNYSLFLENEQIADIGEYVAIWQNIDGEWMLYLQQWDSKTLADINDNLNIEIRKAIRELNMK